MWRSLRRSATDASADLTSSIPIKTPRQIAREEIDSIISDSRKSVHCEVNLAGSHYWTRVVTKYDETHIDSDLRGYLLEKLSKRVVSDLMCYFPPNYGPDFDDAKNPSTNLLKWFSSIKDLYPELWRTVLGGVDGALKDPHLEPWHIFHWVYDLTSNKLEANDPYIVAYIISQYERNSNGQVLMDSLDNDVALGIIHHEGGHKYLVSGGGPTIKSVSPHDILHSLDHRKKLGPNHSNFQYYLKLFKLIERASDANDRNPQLFTSIKSDLAIMTSFLQRETSDDIYDARDQAHRAALSVTRNSWQRVQDGVREFRQNLKAKNLQIPTSPAPA